MRGGPRSFSRRLAEHFASTPDAPAIVHVSAEDGAEAETVTRGELDRRVSACAARLASAGVARSAFVCIIGPASADLVACFLACLRLGAVASIFPPQSPLQDADYYVRQQTKALATVNPDHVVLLRADSGVARALGGILGGIHLITIDGAIRPGPESAPGPVEDPGRVLFVQHSSGTTGIKKGVAITDGQLAHQLDAYADLLGMRRGPGRPVIASWLPLYHDMGLVACLLLSLYEGGTLVLLDPFEWVSSPGSLLDAVERYRAEYVWLPNFAFRFLSRCFPRGAKRDLSSVRLWVNCSEPCRLETIDEFARLFRQNGVERSRIACCYAMAETVFAVSQTPPGEEPRHLRIDRAALRMGRPVGATAGPEGLAVLSNGPALPGVEVAVRNEAWEPDGVLGEICVRAPFLFDGYYRRPDLNPGLFVDGFYPTGDIGFVHDGEVYVTGRSKEIIIVHGKNIFATDVEALANEVAGVKGGRCVAFGLDSEASGSEELIVVAERDAASEASLDAVKRALTERIVLEFGMHPRDVLIVDERWLVKSTSGKISRSDNKLKYMEATRAASA